MPGVSVVITVRNEAAHIEALLESLVGQEVHEVIVVDADSDDDTVALAASFDDRLPLRVLVEPCSRGGGRNLGAARATGDLLAFIDGDCTADPGWVAALATASAGQADRVVAGTTEVTGRRAFVGLDRVELMHKGQDTTWPSCNLAYPKALFDRIGGFDEAFVTAEDIDLNLRAIEAGATVRHAPDALVHARARRTLRGFLRQAYWNGYGRKQLTRKHGDLWGQYKPWKMLAELRSPVGALRLAGGFMGYMRARRETR